MIQYSNVVGYNRNNGEEYISVELCLDEDGKEALIATDRLNIKQVIPEEAFEWIIDPDDL